MVESGFQRVAGSHGASSRAARAEVDWQRNNLKLVMLVKWKGFQKSESGARRITPRIPSVQQTWARELIAQLKLRGDERILDVGCGDGKVTAEMARAVPHGSVVGVDASPQMIEFATQNIFPQNSESGISRDGRAEDSVPPQVRSRLFQRGAALGGRSSGISARRGFRVAIRRSARRFVRWQGKRARCFSRVATGNALETLARVFPQNGSAVFFPQPGGIQKMAAAFWI